MGLERVQQLAVMDLIASDPIECCISRICSLCMRNINLASCATRHWPAGGNVVEAWQSHCMPRCHLSSTTSLPLVYSIDHLPNEAGTCSSGVSDYTPFQATFDKLQGRLMTAAKLQRTTVYARRRCPTKLACAAMVHLRI